MVTSNIIRNKVGLVVGLMLFVSNACALSFKNETGRKVEIKWHYNRNVVIVNNEEMTRCVIGNDASFEVPGSGIKNFTSVITAIEFNIGIDDKSVICCSFNGKDLTRGSYSLKLEKRNSTKKDDKANQEWILLLSTEKLDGKECGLFQIGEVFIKND